MKIKILGLNIEIVFCNNERIESNIGKGKVFLPIL
jgi:hypothetical protein